MNIINKIISLAKQKNKTIIFPEAEFSERVTKAGNIVAKKGIANVVFVGNKNVLQTKIDKCNVNKIKVVDPNNFEQSELIVQAILNARKSKGLTQEQAQELSKDPIYFSCAYTVCGFADGIVCGAEVSTAKTLKPALQIIKSKTGLVSSYFLFNGKNSVTEDVFLMGDCAVVENPTSEQEFLIAEQMYLQSVKLGFNQPRVAFLSYSTLGSANMESAVKVRDAYLMFNQKYPNVQAVGEVQFDASTQSKVAKTKMPNGKFNTPANIFVMPNLDTGNICYKAVQYFAKLQAIGPITIGFNKPVNDLSRGCTVDDIVKITAITAFQCE